MKKVFQFKELNNMKLKNQLYITYVFLLINSIIIISSIYYKTSYNITLKNVEKSSLSLVNNNNLVIDIKLYNILESSEAITLDHDLFNIVSNLENRSNYELLSDDKSINNILFKYFNFSYIYSTHIITPYYNFGSGKIPIKNDFYKNSIFYDIANDNNGSLVWIPTYKFSEFYNFNELENIRLDYEYLFSAVKVLNNLDSENLKFNNENINKDKNVLLINLKPDIFNDILNKDLQYNNSNYYIISKSGEIVYSNNKTEWGKKYKAEWINDIENNDGIIKTEIDNEKYLVCYSRLKSTGWFSAIVIPVRTILSDFNDLGIFILILSLMIVIAGCVFANIISKTVTKPIGKLLESIKEMGNGNFSNKTEIKGSYEITNLITKFNEMDDKIANLIDENYLTKIREREATIMSLNIQLNPHFLYNTLNVINWIAIENDQNEISKIIVSLSSMLQYTANNNEECCEFERDFEWLKRYIYIMQIRFEDRFDVKYNIDSKLMKYKVPKLFLQPFVENSIIHGFDSSEYKGVLEVNGYIDKDKVCFCVYDNGKGIEKEKIDYIIKENKERIGISNVNNRIKLIYGKKYGVKISSELNCGTYIYIYLPLVREESKENPLI
ncbi:sensor histidine kinase [Clostridium cuniculi]|uniref:sensor histidine kinase n=1 Tax=Clostridium cuniculi TaxID=2548455 RepID=UPI001055E423|nr:sensor histidine kinase [Clostridium cuniculi]